MGHMPPEPGRKTLWASVVLGQREVAYGRGMGRRPDGSLCPKGRELVVVVHSPVLALVMLRQKDHES